MGNKFIPGANIRHVYWFRLESCILGYYDRNNMMAKTPLGEKTRKPGNQLSMAVGRKEIRHLELHKHTQALTKT